MNHYCKLFIFISLYCLVGCSHMNKQETKRDPAARPVNLRESVVVNLLLDKNWEIECNLIDKNLVKDTPLTATATTLALGLKDFDVATLLSLTYDETHRRMFGSVSPLVFHYKADSNTLSVEGFLEDSSPKVSFFRTNVYPQGENGELLEGIIILFERPKAYAILEKTISLKLSLSQSTDRFLGVLFAGKTGIGSCIMEKQGI